MANEDSLAGPIAGLGSSLLATGGNIISTAMTNQANKDLWREQMAYNTPLAQRKRLELAGYNPALAMGHGGVAGLAGSPPTMDSPRIDSPSNDILAMQQIKISDAQRENILAQTRVERAKAEIAEHDARIINKPQSEDIPSNSPWFVRGLAAIGDRLRDWWHGKYDKDSEEPVPVVDTPSNETWRSRKHGR